MFMTLGTWSFETYDKLPCADKQLFSPLIGFLLHLAVGAASWAVWYICTHKMMGWCYIYI